MATQSVLEKVRCPKCNNIVPKRANCSMCGQALNAKPITPPETANKIEDPNISRTRAYQQFLRERLFKENARLGSPNQPQKVEKPPQKIVKANIPKVMENVVPEVEKIIPQKVETVDTELEKASDEEENAKWGLPDQSQEVEKSPVKNDAPKVMENVVPEVEKIIPQKVETVDTELEKASDENENATQGPLNQSQKVEKPSQKIVKNNVPKVMENVVPEVEKMMPQKVEMVNTKVEKVSDGKKPSPQNVDPRSYMPDLYTKEIVEKMAKQVKYEVNLVQLFKEGQVPEEIFTRLFNGMTDEITGLISRRGEATKELSGLMNGYKSTVLSAQQGMKLLDLRKSLEDVSEEEYKVKAAALSWDINHYGEKISEGLLKADYLKNLGGLIPVDEANDLKKIAAGCMDASSMKHVNDSVRENIRKAMQEASSILNEVYSS